MKLIAEMEPGHRVSDFERVGSGQFVRPGVWPGFEFILTRAFIVALFLHLSKLISA